MTWGKFLRWIALGCLVALLLVACAWLRWELAVLRIRIAFADEQTEIIAEMRRRALSAEAGEAARCLRYAAHYYPSGTKQERGSSLDRIVERQRSQAIEDIIAHLRTKTGRDLGVDPEPWIEAYSN
jgi:hypothetical protein